MVNSQRKNRRINCGLYICLDVIANAKWQIVKNEYAVLTQINITISVAISAFTNNTEEICLFFQSFINGSFEISDEYKIDKNRLIIP